MKLTSLRIRPRQLARHHTMASQLRPLWLLLLAIGLTGCQSQTPMTGPLTQQTWPTPTWPSASWWNPNAIPTSTMPTGPSAPASSPALAQAPTAGLPSGAPNTGLSAAASNDPNAAIVAQANSQIQELERRLRLLDENNRQLTNQLAQSQQQMQLHRDRANLMTKQLQDLSGQLAQAQIGQIEASRQSQELKESIQKRGSAILTANQSQNRSIEPAPPDFTANRSNNLPPETPARFGPLSSGAVGQRMTIPADQLCLPGTTQWAPSAAGVLDRLTETIRQSYPRQRISIEGHTDAAPLPPGSYSTPYQLSAAQSMAVLEYLVRRSQLPASQFQSLAFGDSRPVGSQQTAEGRSANRRLDIVVATEGY
ncbi:MAG: flagellar motor protein MotB [Pirellulaceae bacterium]